MCPPSVWAKLALHFAKLVTSVMSSSRFVVYFFIGISVLVYSGKIGTNFVPVIGDALLTISAFISPKWFVDVYAAQPVQNTPEETEECDTILQ